MISPNALTRWLVVFLAVAVLVGTVRVAATFDLRVAYDYNEGWNAYHQADAAAGRNPYPPVSSFRYNNYPPLSFYIVGAAGRLTGDNIAAGRAVSLIGFLLTCLGIIQAACLMGCTRPQAWFGALLFAAMLLYDYNYVGMNDPQLLGQAFGMAGIVAALRTPRRRASLSLAAALFALAALTKQTLMIAPLTLTAWLFIADRRAAFQLAVASASLGLLALALFQATFGISLWSQIAVPRIWSLASGLESLEGWMQASAVPVLASLFLWRRFPEDSHVVFCCLYLMLSIGIGAVFLCGAGTSGNMLFDALIALSLCAAVGLNRLAAAGQWANAFALCQFFPVIAILVFHTVTDSFYPRYWLDRGAAPIAETRRDVAFVRSRTGRALCAPLAICYWAGKPAEYDPFMMRQSVTLGRRDGRDLRDAIRGHRYEVLVLETSPAVQFSYRPDIAAAALNNYRLDHADSVGTFWTLRSPDPR